MIFLLDQDVPDPIARVIQQAGHEAQRLRELLPIESPDSAVLALAHSRNALLVTCNRDDFLSLAQTTPHAGQRAWPNAVIFSACCKPPEKAACATTSILPELL